MLPDDKSCRLARSSRDASTVGVVFAGDGVRFCQPVCPSRVPAKTRLEFFPSAAAALAVGRIPCDRCHPLDAPRIPDWRLSEPVVQRGLRMLWSGSKSTRWLAQLSDDFGVSKADIHQRFVAELGVSPAVLSRVHAQWVRDQLARTYEGSSRTTPLRLHLRVRAPYDAAWVFGFLDKRSLPGLEEVVGDVYQRRLVGAPAAADPWLRVAYDAERLTITLPRWARAQAAALLGRVAHVFDVHADPLAIDEGLSNEPWLRPQVTRGIRVPGAWDGFETAVRAILGQQVSVARARVLAIELMQRFASDGFPTPAELVEADVSAIGMPGKRGGAVRALAGAVLDGLALDNTVDAQTQFETLCALPGIGPWTAGYVAMRVSGDANAFPRGDWVILKQLGLTAGMADKYSARWSPWRAYALMYIWQASSEARGKIKPARL